MYKKLKYVFCDKKKYWEFPVTLTVKLYIKFNTVIIVLIFIN